MAEIITNQGLQLLAQHQGNNTALVIDTIVLGYTDGQLPADTIDPDRGYPTAGEIVYTSPVTYSGYMSPDMVVYSLNMGESVGPFVFNTLYCVASGDSNAVVMVITLPDTQKIATDIAQGIRGQAMIRNAVMVYAGAQQITNITVEAAAWQFAYEKATTVVYGITREATQEEVNEGTSPGIFVSPEKLNSWYFNMMEGWFFRQLWVFGSDDLPDDFPGFIHNGQIVPNGWIDYAKFANSGYRFISRVNENDMLIHDLSNVVRGQGSSERAVGDFEGDAIRDFIISYTRNKPFYDAQWPTENIISRGQSKSGVETVILGRPSDSVPTANENRVKSNTFLFACYHGEF